MALENLFGTGGGTFISRLLGEKKLVDAKIVSSVTFYFSLIAGLLLILFCIPFLHHILQLLGAKGDTILSTREFILVFIIGSPIVIANFALEQIVRAEGASKVSMNGMALSVIVNIILDPILIFVCHLSIMGASLGTIIGNFFVVFYYVYYLQRKSSFLTVSVKAFKPSSKITKEIFKILHYTLLFWLHRFLSHYLFSVHRFFSCSAEIFKSSILELIFLRQCLFLLYLPVYPGCLQEFFQGIGREKEATIMSVARGMILIPIMITGNFLWGLQGVIWSLTA
jgi:multidrug efflux pump